MSKNNKILVIVLAALVVLFLIINQMKNPKEKRVKFFNVPAESIFAVEITTAKDTLRIVKDDTNWSIELPFVTEINLNKVETLFEKIIPAETSSIPVSISEESLPQYRLDGIKGTTIAFFSRDNKELVKGTLSRIGSTTYAKRSNNNDVYQLTENIAAFVTSNLYDWRAQYVVSINKQNIKKISVEYSQNNYTITNKDTLWVYKDKEAEFEVSDVNPAIIKITKELEDLPALNFYDYSYEKYKERIQNPVLTLNIEKRDNTTVNLVFALEEDNIFIAQKDNNTEHLYAVSDESINLFTISSERFKQELQ